MEDTNLEDTGDLIDLAGQSLNSPDTVLAIAILAGLEICLDQHRRERSVDDEETLVGLEGTFFLASGASDERVYATEVLELGENAVSGDRRDFNGDSLPICKEAGLELAVV